MIQDGTDFKGGESAHDGRSPRDFVDPPRSEHCRNTSNNLMIRCALPALRFCFSSWANRVCFAPFQGDPVDETDIGSAKSVDGYSAGRAGRNGDQCGRSGTAPSEPDPKSYWDVSQIRPGMKGVGRTVMVGTKLEEFGAEVLGVMRDVSPGRDMVLCRLTGCNLEHAGIIQGMSGSPIYIDGKLLGAVAFAWEFAKDPIAGVTPFSQMIQYVRSNDRRIAAESKEPGKNRQFHASALPFRPLDRWTGTDRGWADSPALPLPIPVSGGGIGGMTPIVTPLAASGFGPRALSLLAERLRPIGHGPHVGRGRVRSNRP